MTLQKVGVNLEKAYSTQDFGLGELHITESGDFYRFMQADGAVTKDLLYTVASGFQVADAVTTTVIADTNVYPLGSSNVTLADDEYAWIFVGPGMFTHNPDGDILVNEILYTTTTAGKLDNVATAGLVRGVMALGTVTSSAGGDIYASIPLYGENLP